MLVCLDYEPDPVPWWVHNDSVWAAIVGGWFECRWAVLRWRRFIKFPNPGDELWSILQNMFWDTLAPEYQADSAWSAPWEEEPPF